MKNLFQNLLLWKEMDIERKELKDLGLTAEEIECYFDFYVDSYLPKVDNETVLN